MSRREWGQGGRVSVMRWRRSGTVRLSLGCLLLALCLWLLSPASYRLVYSGRLLRVSPLQVWEFLIDFNNMKLLNPTVLEVWLEKDEGGRRGEWHYSLGYREFLHQIPWIENQARAEYRCIAPSLPNQTYLILSKHYTCFFGNLTCVESSAEFRLEGREASGGSDTELRETVQYQCPRLLSSFCYNEVLFQRKAIFENLDRILSTK